MDNLEIYSQVCEVPKEAQKAISAGRLKGMTDINPMWRIRTLTELFGAAGFGWVAPIKRTWLDTGANGEITVNVECELSYKYNGEWSKPISGIGGSKLVTKENAGLYTDDEAYKKAYTDALSVACKALGIGAKVYWAADNTKYTGGEKVPMITPEQIAEFSALGIRVERTLQKYGVEKIEELTEEQAAAVIAGKKAYDERKMVEADLSAQGLSVNG